MNCEDSALSRRVGALQISISIIIMSVCASYLFGCSVWGVSLENVFAIFPASPLSLEMCMFFAASLRMCGSDIRT